MICQTLHCTHRPDPGQRTCRSCQTRAVPAQNHRRPGYVSYATSPGPVDLPDLSAGLCFGANDDHWYGTDERDRREAARPCRACPVVDACREYAMAARERHGVWGATTEPERAAIWKRGKRA